MSVLRLLFFCISLAALLLAPRARADDRAEAARAKTAGDRAMVNLEYQSALEHYSRALEITPDNAALHYNIGRALQALERYPEALVSLERFVKDAPEELRSRVPKLDELLDEVRDKISTLSVTAQVEGAQVLLNGKRIGTTPIRGAQVVAGRGELEVRADGFRPMRKTIVLTPRGSHEVTLSLIPKDPTAYLRIESSVAGATASVDGVQVGALPTEVSLAPGEHQVVVEHDGYESYESTVALAPAARQSLHVDLEPTRPVYESWWFWTPLAVVVAGGVSAGVAIALTVERDADRGDIEPGIIKVTIPMPSFSF